MSNTIRVVVNDIGGEPEPSEETSEPTVVPEIPLIPETGVATHYDSSNSKLLCGASVIFLGFAALFILAVLALKRRKYRKFDVDFNGEDELIGRKFDTRLYVGLIGFAAIFAVFGVGSVFEATSEKAIADDNLTVTGSNMVIEINRDLSTDTTIYYVLQTGEVTVDRATTNGYDLYAYAPNGINRLNSVDEDNEAYIASVSGDLSMNTWGLLLDDAEEYSVLPVDEQSALLIDSVSEATSAGHRSNIGFGVLVDLDLPEGVYEGEIEYKAVKKPSEETVNMTLQEWSGCDSLGVGEVVDLTDVRDGQTYPVSKLYMDLERTETKCWMMGNLNLGAIPLTVSELNYTNTNTSSSISASDFYSWNNAEGTHSDPVFIPVTSENSKTGSAIDDLGNKYGVLYDFSAASANTYSYEPGVMLAYDDLCPKNWRLPNSDDDELSQLLSGYGITTSSLASGLVLQGTLRMPLSGFFDVSMAGSAQVVDGQGEMGFYWLSVKPSESGVRRFGRFGFDSEGNLDIAEPGLDGSYSMRCVFGEPSTVSQEVTYTLKYDANGGTGAPTTQTGVSSTGSYEFTLSSDVPVWGNKSFMGWRDSVLDSGDQIYQPGQFYTAFETDVTLYAIWDDGGSEPGGGTTLQGWTGCSSLGVNETIVLNDARDGQSYTVGKFYMDSAHDVTNARCWIMQDLNLGAIEFVTDLNSSNTNISSGVTIPATTFNSWIKTSTVNSYTEPVVMLITEATSETGSIIDAYGNKYGALYNFAATSAGTYNFAEDAGAGNAQYDLCPSGWRLPTGGASGEFAQLITLGNGVTSSVDGATVLQRDLGFSLSGLFFNTAPITHQGAEGHSWASTFGDASHMSTADYYTASVYPNSSSGRSDGHSIRCIKI